MPDIDPICELIDDAVDKHQALDGMEDVVTWHGSVDAMVVVNGERGGFNVGHMATWGSEEDYELTDEQHQRIERQAHEMQRQQMLYGEAYLAVDTATGDVQVASPPRTRDGRIWQFSNAGDSPGSPWEWARGIQPIGRLHLNEWQAADRPLRQGMRPTHVEINGVDVTDMVRSVTLDNREAGFQPVPSAQYFVGPNFEPEDGGHTYSLGTRMHLADPVAFRLWTDDEMAQVGEHARESYRQMGECMRDFAAAVRPAFEAVGEALQRFCGLVQSIAEARAEHRKQLHRSYRLRCLARRRRSR